jgi:hypothetical protein
MYHPFRINARQALVSCGEDTAFSPNESKGKHGTHHFSTAISVT